MRGWPTSTTPISTGTKAPTSTKISPLSEASDSDLLTIIDTNQKIVKNFDKSTDMCDYVKSELAERKIVHAMEELQKRHGCYLPQKRHFTFNGTQSEEINSSIERCLNDPENTNIADEILVIKNNKLRENIVKEILAIRSSDDAFQQDLADTFDFDPEHENIDRLFERNKIKDNRDTAIIQPAPKRIKTKHERFVEPVQPNGAVADTLGHEILVNLQIETVQSNVATTVRKFQCLKCEASYTYKRDLTRHNIESHMNIEKYRCDECKTEFKHKRNLTSHNKTKHNC